MNVNCLMKSSTKKSLILVVLSPSGSSSIPVLLPQPFELPSQAPSPNSIPAPSSQEDTMRNGWCLDATEDDVYNLPDHMQLFSE